MLSSHSEHAIRSDEEEPEEQTDKNFGKKTDKILLPKSGSSKIPENFRTSNRAGQMNTQAAHIEIDH